MRYDFASLSGLDFEELVHDLLQRSWGIRLEIFKAGKDGGVDLRALQGAGRLIVQCKNYAATPYTTLKARMREELPKIRHLGPTRYVLVTSLPLSVAQKDELVALLSPFVQSGGDVIGANELERMLEAAPDIVKRHHKLWLTSVPVLERILHAAEHEQTKAHVERVAGRLPLFVQTNAYGRALDALEDHRIVIISGAPGIGKTTLADMLLYAHVSDGFTPAVIRGGLAEGRRLASGGGPIIFHFDDFLGQTFLGDRPDFLGRKEDADLVDFIDWVLAHDQHRFVLTTREHILADALQRSEKLRHRGIGDERCVVTVRDFRRDERARILYNHLYFSSLPAAYRQEMLRDDFFLEVVDSKDFNPRIVEWLASERRLRSIPPEQYREHVRALIKNPSEIWRHAFHYELSQAARDILVARLSLSYVVFADDLERAFESLHARSITRTNQKSASGAWRAAMKELEGSFLEVRRGEVEFINPSVRDFMSSVIQDNPEIALDVVASAVRFNQVTGILEGAAPEGPFPAARTRLLDSQNHLADAFARLLDAPSLRWRKEPRGHIGRYIDSSLPTRTELLLKFQRTLRTIRPVTLRAIQLVANEIQSGGLNISDVTGLLDRSHRHQGDWKDLSPVLGAVRQVLGSARAEDWLALHNLGAALGVDLEAIVPSAEEAFETYQSNGVMDEQWNCSDRDGYETLQYQLEKLQEKHGFDFRSEIESIAEALSELDEEEPEHEPILAGAGRLEHDNEPEADDETLRAMFRSLASPE